MSQISSDYVKGGLAEKSQHLLLAILGIVWRLF